MKWKLLVVSSFFLFLLLSFAGCGDNAVTRKETVKQDAGLSIRDVEFRELPGEPATVEWSATLSNNCGLTRNFKIVARFLDEAGKIVAEDSVSRLVPNAGQQRVSARKVIRPEEIAKIKKLNVSAEG